MRTVWEKYVLGDAPLKWLQKQDVMSRLSKIFMNGAHRKEDAGDSVATGGILQIGMITFGEKVNWYISRKKPKTKDNPSNAFDTAIRHNPIWREQKKVLFLGLFCQVQSFCQCSHGRLETAPLKKNQSNEYGEAREGRQDYIWLCAVCCFETSFLVVTSDVNV